MSLPSAEPIFNGRLFVTVISAHNLVGGSSWLGTKQDLYCSIACGNEKFKTTTCVGAGACARWNQVFLINLDTQEKNQDLVHFNVKVPHMTGATHVGCSAIKVKDFWRGANDVVVEKTVQLVDSSNFTLLRGQLDISVRMQLKDAASRPTLLVPPPYCAPASAITFHSEPAVSAPVKKRELKKEPMLLLDTTGSMEFGIFWGSHHSRMQVVSAALEQMVPLIAHEDGEAKEQEEEGGIRTITFSGGEAEDIGDLTPSNVRRKLAQIQPDGCTEILPGFQKMLEVYREEFGEKPASEQPLLMALVITDGALLDGDAFEEELGKLHGKVFVHVALVGYGTDFVAALKDYRDIASRNSHVQVTDMSHHCTGAQLAADLMKVISH